MTKGIEDALGLRPMNEALKEQEENLPVSQEDEDDYDPYSLPVDFDAALRQQIDTATQDKIAEQMLSGKDTEEKLDELFEILKEKAETMADLAMELDPGKAPRAFEVMNQIFKNAMDAVTSKRDHQLKTLKLILDQKKFEHERSNVDPTAIPGDRIVATMTTADLVRDFRKALNEAPNTETRTSPSE